MPAVSRREFVINATAGAAVAGLLSASPPKLGASPLGWPIGCQTYPVRAMIGQDFPGAVKQLAEAGFQRIELCPPVDYASSGFGDIARYKGPELRRLLGDRGLKCESSHFAVKELRDNLAGRISWAEITSVGKVTLDWTKIFAAAKVAGRKNYFVEMDLELMKASVPYLRNLQV